MRAVLQRAFFNLRTDTVSRRAIGLVYVIALTLMVSLLWLGTTAQLLLQDQLVDGLLDGGASEVHLSHGGALPSAFFTDTTLHLFPECREAEHVTAGIDPNAKATLLRSTPQFLQARPQRVVRGRLPTLGEAYTVAPPAIVGANHAALFGSDVALQATGFRHHVIGVLSPGVDRDRDSEILVISARPPRCTTRTLWLHARPNQVPTRLATLRDRLTLDQGVPRTDSSVVADVSENVARIASFTTETSARLFSLLGILLSVAVTFSLLVLFAVRMNHRHFEIGLAKTVGARPWQIRAEFLLESVGLFVVALPAAALPLCGVHYLVSHLSGYSPTTAYPFMLVAAFLIVVTMLCSALVVWPASRKAPIVGLEAPLWT